MKICSQSELDGGKTGKIEAVDQLKPFLALWSPFIWSTGVVILMFPSLLFSPH